MRVHLLEETSEEAGFYTGFQVVRSAEAVALPLALAPVPGQQAGGHRRQQHQENAQVQLWPVEASTQLDIQRCSSTQGFPCTPALQQP
jgi:hypothetical protein